MRPIQLRFGGLHSYREPQEVDFTALLGAGVFGIFGPTGSGKSTVLDAVTLALYGKVERAARNTQGILNHAEKRLFVSFSFALGGEQYRVERSYLRADEHTVRAGPGRLVRLSAGGTEEVLADKDREITQRVQAVLGLTVDDFTRAVVLPQGKFAEFLQLDGNDRRRMLERIFALHQYGEQLGQRLRGRLEETEKQLVGVEREQAGLGDASAEAVAAAAKRLAEAEAAAAAAEAALRRAEAEHSRWQQVWELQQELGAVDRRLAEWHGREEQAGAWRAELQEARRAEAVRHPLAGAEQAATAATRAAAALAQSEAMLAEARAAEATAAGAHGAVRERRLQHGPALLQRQHRLEQAVELEQGLQALVDRAQELAERVTKGLRLTEEARRAVEQCAAERSALQAEQAAALQRLAECEVPAQRRRQVQAAQAALTGCDEARHLLTQARAQVEAKERAQAEAAAQVAEAAKRAAALDARVSEHGRAAAAEARAAEAAAATAEASARAALEAATAGQAAAAAALRRAERQHLAAALATDLTAGEPCPVCGATGHPAPARGGGEAAVAAAQANLDGAEQALSAARAQWEEAGQRLRRDWQAREEAGRRLLQELQQAASAAAAAAAEAAAVERAAAAAMAEAGAGLRQAAVELAAREARLTGLLADLRGDGGRDWDAPALVAEAAHIEARDGEAATLQQRLRALAQQGDGLDRQLQERQAVQQRYGEALQQRQLEQAAANQELATRRQQVHGLTGGEPAGPLLVAVRVELRALEEAEATAATALEAAARLRSEREAAAAAARREHELALLQRTETAAALAAALAAAGFGTPAAAAAALREPDRQQELEAQIRSQGEEGLQLQAQHRRVVEALADQRLDAAAWAEQQVVLVAARARQQAAVALVGERRRDHEQLQAHHLRWQRLAEQRRELAAAQNDLRHLQQLLRGNAFVEFLAEEQMRQVAAAASERLGVLTRHRYALEVDSGGGFIMRDDWSGGVRRPVNSLSGGETFLTSLALALALSAQIQLRGQYPLEFFFLDEGFGTLDPELLEVVMDSLERLQCERLHVGVISHVPELRSRLQRRLVVEPAGIGDHGSRLRLETA